MRTSRVGFHSDVYSFGIILLTLLTGRGPAVVDQSDISFAKQCEESSEAGQALPEKLAALQLERGRERGSSAPRPKRPTTSCMALRRWVAALSRAGQIQAVPDPFLWPLWEQSSLPAPEAPGAGGAAGSRREGGAPEASLR